MPIRAIRIEIAKPVNGTWDQLGVLLRTQRRITSQLLRAGMDARIACGVVGAAAVKGKVAPAVRGASPQTMVYQAMKAELESIKGGKWRDEARPALDVCGGMLSALSERVQQSYKKRASFNSEQPIAIRKQETRVVERDGAIILELKLTSEGRCCILARPSSGAHWGTLRKIAAGEIKHGDSKIVYDEDRKKWYVLLSYDAPIREAAARDDAAALIVHRGVNNAITLMSSTGHYSAEPGRKLLHQLRMLETRMRDARRIAGEYLGDGAHGHGKARRYAHYDQLDNKRAAVIKTWCQQTAALVCRRAGEHGCGTIVIEDYGGINPSEDKHLRRVLVRFPLFQLKQAIKNAAELRALKLDEVPAEYISSTCPACANADFRQHNFTTGVFHCGKCSLERPADFVAALNMLRRTSAPMPVWDERMEAMERLRKTLREEPDAAE